MSRAEFDHYAREYQGGMEHPLKRLLGSSRESYLARKIEWIGTRLAELATARQTSPTAFHVLEVGCGDGALVRGIRRGGFAGSLHGCDVSQEMLAAATVHAGVEDQIAFSVQGQEDGLPFDDGQFDAVILSAVLHHVPVAARRTLLVECNRVLRPGGVLLVIEHNPWNPITRFVVAGTKIDQHAELLSCSSLCKLIYSLGEYELTVDYMMFVPPRFPILVGLERYLAWLPLGGQYAVACQARFAEKRSCHV